MTPESGSIPPRKETGTPKGCTYIWESFYRQEGGARELLSKDKFFFQIGPSFGGSSHPAGDLSRADQEISDPLLKGHISGRG